jgi:hypothetical protein
MNPIQTSGRQFQSLCNFPQFLYTCITAQSRIIIQLIPMSSETKKKKKYSRNVMNVDWGLVVKLALPAKVTRRANKVIGIYDRSH